VAEQKVKEFLERVEYLNEFALFIYRVERALVFGSYLSSAELLGDVDIAINLVPKIDDPQAFHELKDMRIEAAHCEGVRFRNTTHRAYWPRLDALRYLKSRSTVISLHEIDDGILALCESRIIYQQTPKAARAAAAAVRIIWGIS
jgi:hypothetical protein